MHPCIIPTQPLYSRTLFLILVIIIHKSVAQLSPTVVISSGWPSFEHQLHHYWEYLKIRGWICLLRKNRTGAEHDSLLYSTESELQVWEALFTSQWIYHVKHTTGKISIVVRLSFSAFESNDYNSRCSINDFYDCLVTVLDSVELQNQIRYIYTHFCHIYNHMDSM